MKDIARANLTIALEGGEGDLEKCVHRLEEMDFQHRLWKEDPGIWKQDAGEQALISNSIGWLQVLRKMDAGELQGFLKEVRGAGFSHVVHMGMGGSSLAPMAFTQTFGTCEGGLPVTVLDSTDPAEVLRIEREIPISSTLFIEASKSGSTVESRSFGEYFYAKVHAVKGNRAGENFAVITDPGSMLQNLAKERGYRKIFLNFPDIGGRYSALSYFGMVPAALMGIDIPTFLDRAGEMMRACGRDVALEDNPGALIGAVMGVLAESGRDKLTFFVPGCMATFGMWLEQLIAESTGKEGKGILPVTGETVGDPSVYGQDRLFVHLRLEKEPEQSIDERIEALKKAGQPVLTITLNDRYDLAREFYRWEIATAAAGAILKINPFDQPNVQESKTITGQILSKIGGERKLPADDNGFADGPLRIYSSGASTAPEALSSFFRQVKPGDYLAFLAYITENERTERLLQDIRGAIRDGLRIATTIGYGPRYLHSTGQLHKGGPNSGLFLQLTADDPEDADIPGQHYSFGMLRRAQALGDLQALGQHGRRVLRVHIEGGLEKGLNALNAAVRKALKP